MIALWGSENLFWTVPQEPLRLVEWGATWAAYSLVAAAALSVVLWAGIGGWRAAFLGGAILGFGIEGVIVGRALQGLGGGAGPRVARAGRSRRPPRRAVAGSVCGVSIDDQG